MKNITIYSDGSSLNNHKKNNHGGYCSILRYKSIEKIIKGSAYNTTNNRMELIAVIEALKIVKEPCNIEIISDSKYVCESINSWLNTWIKKDFKNVKNLDLWKEYISLAKNHNIRATWIKGHDGHKENELCDMLARKEAENLRDSITKEIDDK